MTSRALLTHFTSWSWTTSNNVVNSHSRSSWFRDFTSRSRRARWTRLSIKTSHSQFSFLSLWSITTMTSFNTRQTLLNDLLMQIFLYLKNKRFLLFLLANPEILITPFHRVLLFALLAQQRCYWKRFPGVPRKEKTIQQVFEKFSESSQTKLTGAPLSPRSPFNPGNPLRPGSPSLPLKPRIPCSPFSPREIWLEIQISISYVVRWNC